LGAKFFFIFLSCSLSFVKTKTKEGLKKGGKKRKGKGKKCEMATHSIKKKWEMPAKKKKKKRCSNY